MTTQLNKKLNWILLSIIPAIFFICVTIILINTEGYRTRVLYDSDINWLLRTGEYIYTHNFQLPDKDIFSYTNPNRPWILYQWLFEVITYLTFSIGSFNGLALFAIGIYSLTFTLLFILIKRLNVNYLYTIIPLSIAIWGTNVNWYTRPAIITYLFTCLILLILNYSETKNYKFLWFIPLIFLIWANCHLGFEFGIILIITYSIYKAIQYMYNKSLSDIKLVTTAIYISILSIIATFINPYGIKLYIYMFNLANSPFMNQNIQELTSPDFHNIKYYPILIILTLNILLIRFSKKISFYYILFYAISTIFTLIFLRNLPYFFIFSTIIVALQLQNLHEAIINNDKLSNLIKKPFIILNKLQSKTIETLSDTPKVTKLPLNTIIIITFIVIMIPLQNIEHLKNNYIFTLHYSNARPVDAYQFILKHKPKGNFFTISTWGSYAIYMLYPHYKVYYDTRYDMYGDKFVSEAIKIESGEKIWKKIFNKYNINWAVLPNNSILKSKLIKNNWGIIYKDETASILMKKSPNNVKWYKNSGLQNLLKSDNKKIQRN